MTGLETIVLKLIERLLGDAIRDALKRTGRQREREELVRRLREELHAELSGIREDIHAISLAVAELDVVVERDPDLRWSDDRLEVMTIVSEPAAIQELRVVIEHRRRELGVSSPPPTIKFATDQDPSELPDASDGGTAWRKSVIGLGREVKAERRRRSIQ